MRMCVSILIHRGPRFLSLDGRARCGVIEISTICLGSKTGFHDLLVVLTVFLNLCTRVYSDLDALCQSGSRSSRFPKSSNRTFLQDILENLGENPPSTECQLVQ